MAFQDDSREEDMRKIFNLTKVGGRIDTDAILNLNYKDVNLIIEFELKTTSNPYAGVTTVRDFGPDHIKKWKTKHWLFAFYDSGNIRYFYGSPKLLKPWIDEKEMYIAPDLKLSELVSKKLTHDDLIEICGDRDIYTIDDAKRIHKQQYNIKTYKSLMDMDNGYSKSRMLEILKDRVEYVIKRGSTLNNPHIPYSYFSTWTTEIISNHAEQLRLFVTDFLNEEC